MNARDLVEAPTKESDPIHRGDRSMRTMTALMQKIWSLRNANFYANFYANRYPRMPTLTKSLKCLNLEQAASPSKKNRTRTDLFHPCGFLAPFTVKPPTQLTVLKKPFFYAQDF